MSQYSKAETACLSLSRASHRGALLAVLLGLITLLNPAVEAQQRRTAPATRPAAQGNYEQLKQQADQARESGQLEAAIPLYRQAVALRPNWVDGWWYLATLLYDRDQYAEAVQAFKKTAALQPKAGAPLALLGLCEFRLHDYDNALKHLRAGQQIGIGDNQELERVMRYHEGLILLLKGDFETSQLFFGRLSYDNVNTEDVIIAHGLAALRRPTLPALITAEHRQRDLIRRVGLAEHQAAQLNMGDAQAGYRQVATEYATAPNVQYAYGRFLLNQRDDEGALAAFRKEIENSPEHVLARLQITYIHLKNKEAAAALDLVQEAIQLHPRLHLGHYLLGRVWFDLGENEKAIAELEAARRTAPNEARIHFALSRAYAKAGRKAEAEQARETFARLNKMAEEAAARGEARGDAINENVEKGKPDSPPQ